MIQNKRILELLDEKTQTEPEIREFLEGVFERESEGKHFTNYYREQITKMAKERG